MNIDSEDDEVFNDSLSSKEIEMKLLGDNSKNDHKLISGGIPNKKFKEKILILKDLFVISFAFLLLFTAFQSIQNLQSSLNSESGIGTKSLTIIYSVMIIGNLFFAPFIVIRVGCKITITVCILMYCVYILANFPTPYHYITLIIGAFILGSAGSPLWIAQTTYTNMIGMRYAQLTHQDPRTVIPRFFGTFSFIVESAQIWGNLISYEVLNKAKSLMNESLNFSVCGYYFRHKQSNNTSLNNLPLDSTVYELCGIYFVCGVAASLIIFILLSNKKNENIQSSKLSLDMLTKTLKHLKDDNRQPLLIVITTYTTMMAAFRVSDFTEAYVNCALGTDKVGFVMCLYGIFNCTGSIFFGTITKWVGRISIITLAAIIDIIILITLLQWTPDPEHSYVIFIIASLMGITGSIWESQMTALYGNLFYNNQEAGFSNKGVWGCIGSTAAFAYSSHLNVDVKIYILFAFLTVGMPMYYFTEVLDGKKRHSMTVIYEKLQQ